MIFIYSTYFAAHIDFTWSKPLFLRQIFSWQGFDLPFPVLSTTLNFPHPSPCELDPQVTQLPFASPVSAEASSQTCWDSEDKRVLCHPGPPSPSLCRELEAPRCLPGWLEPRSTQHTASAVTVLCLLCDGEKVRTAQSSSNCSTLLQKTTLCH